MNVAQQRTYQRDWKVTGAVFMMLLSGFIHLTIISHHFEHAPAHGIAMGVIGALEVVWAVAYWWRPSKMLAQVGAILAISLITLWVITRIAPAPFTNEAEEIDFSGVVTKLLEAFSAAALLVVVVSAVSDDGARRSAPKIIFTVLLISLLLTVGVYEAARAAQPLFPQLGPPAMEPMNDHEWASRLI